MAADRRRLILSPDWWRSREEEGKKYSLLLLFYLLPGSQNMSILLSTFRKAIPTPGSKIYILYYWLFHRQIIRFHSTGSQTLFIIATKAIKLASLPIGTEERTSVVRCCFGKRRFWSNHGFREQRCNIGPSRFFTPAFMSMFVSVYAMPALSASRQTYTARKGLCGISWCFLSGASFQDDLPAHPELNILGLDSNGLTQRQTYTRNSTKSSNANRSNKKIVAKLDTSCYKYSDKKYAFSAFLRQFRFDKVVSNCSPLFLPNNKIIIS